MSDTTSQTLLRTPLFDQHVALNAKMVGFGGWEMPLQYESILLEWQYNRQGVTIFDCSHMGEFLLHGPAFVLETLVTQRISDMPIGTCRYGAILNEGGGVVDDLIVYRQGQEAWMIVVNAANIDKDRAHFQKYLSSQMTFEDVSARTAKLDVQGPLSRDVLLQWVPGIERLKYYEFDTFELFGVSCLISRTGYTGELGYEIYCPWEKAKNIWQGVLKDARVKPTGLGVRDVLRIEMCFSLYGHELADDVSALQSGLSKFIDLNKTFVGRESIIKHKPKLMSAAIVSDSRRSPRQGHNVYNTDGKVVGVVTSGSFSPGVEAGIGIAFIEIAANTIGDSIAFGDDKMKTTGRIVKRPFYTKGSLKN